MLDFPASPSTGQIYQGWQWDSQKWKQASGAQPMPPVTDTGRNMITNGTFAVAQRGAGPWTANVSYTADRWFLTVVNSTASVSLIAATDADRAAIGNEAATTIYQSVGTGTSGAGDLIIPAEQHFESVQRLSGKTVTISFWAKATAGTSRVGIEFWQHFGNGGSPSADVSSIGSQSFTLSTTWARYSATVAIPSASGKVFGTTTGTDYTAFRFWQSAGSNANAEAGGVGVQSYTLQLWGVQLEIGSVATALDAGGTPQQILAEAQRFYFTTPINLGGASPVSGAMSFGNTMLFPVAMRAAPTCVLSNQSYVNASALTVTVNGNTGAYPGITVTAGNNVFGAGGTAAFSADL